MVLESVSLCPCIEKGKHIAKVISMEPKEAPCCGGVFRELSISASLVPDH